MCSYLLSLAELPPPPQLDQNYSYQEMTRRLEERKTASTSDADGWLVVGAGEHYQDVRVEPDTQTPADPPHQSSITLRSTNSSTTTISRPSPPPSVSIRVDSMPHPNASAIDVSDEGRPGDVGQEDRADGRVDQVFRLHSSRRMKPTSSGRGVSIPSRKSSLAFLADAQRDDGSDTSTSYSRSKPRKHTSTPAQLESSSDP